MKMKMEHGKKAYTRPEVETILMEGCPFCDMSVDTNMDDMEEMDEVIFGAKRHTGSVWLDDENETPGGAWN